MDIKYVCDAVIPDYPANTVHIMKMCSAFSSNNNKVDLYVHKMKKKPICAEPFEYYGIDNHFRIIEVLCPKIHGGALIYGCISLLCILFSKKNIVYGRSLYTCSLAAHFAKCPVVYEVHGSIDKKSKMGRWFSYLLKGKYLARIVVISRALAEYLMDKWNISQSLIYIAPDAADCPVKKGEGNCLQRTERVNIGYIGHLYEGRGINIIIEIARQFPDYMFHVIGGSRSDVNKWKERMLSDNIVFYGHVAPSEVYDYACNLDVLLAPYQRRVLSGSNDKNAKEDTAQWMSPLKLFEYMSYEKPIICSDLPVVHEVLTNNETAILVDPEEVKEWIDGINKIVGDKELADRISQNAKNEFVEKYTWKARAKNVIAGLTR